MAEYTMQEVEDLNNAGKTLLYPRMIIEGKCGSDELAKAMTRGTFISSGEAKAMLCLLGREIAKQMALGRSVKIDGVGLFSPSLGIKKGKERENADGSGTRRNASSIMVNGVHFRPDKELLVETDRRCNLSRAKTKFARHRSRYTPEQRLDLARQLLADQPFITVKGYALLTGLSQTTAGRELRRWAETPGSGIGKDGFGTHRVYVAKEQ